MYLLNTINFSLVEQLSDPEPYAILSHTWGKEEVSFKDIHDLPAARQKTGFSKIDGACQLARSDDFEYIWIDTCCIDKTSSVELSEAINSMYTYYKEAAVCYVYLADVSINDDPHKEHSQFRQARWFTRGWTLQELLAPSGSVCFYAKTWEEVGTRIGLNIVISAVTGIPCAVLTAQKVANEYSLAQRMSWASLRQTTWVEDMAYSLMGLFNVHLSIIYGEGWASFRRLQLEIMKSSSDRSILAFGFASSNRCSSSAIADSPAEFENCGDIAVLNDDLEDSVLADPERPHYTMTNNGLQISLPLLECGSRDRVDAALGGWAHHIPRNMGRSRQARGPGPTRFYFPKGTFTLVCIPLIFKNGAHYARAGGAYHRRAQVADLAYGGNRRQVFIEVRDPPAQMLASPLAGKYKVRIRTIQGPVTVTAIQYNNEDAAEPRLFDSETTSAVATEVIRHTAAIMIQFQIVETARSFHVVMGTTDPSCRQVWFEIIPEHDSPLLETVLAANLDKLTSVPRDRLSKYIAPETGACVTIAVRRVDEGKLPSGEDTGVETPACFELTVAAK